MQFLNVGPAPRKVGPRDNETATSLLVRLASANGMRDVEHLLRSTPRLCIDQVRNRKSKIEVAARLSGFDASVIDAATPILTGSSHISVAGVKFNRIGVRLGRACPACIAQDLEIFASERTDLRAFRRGWWQVPSIWTCPAHEVSLVADCNDCGQALDEQRPVGTCRCGERHLPKTVVSPDACQHDAWLLGRLGLARRIENPMLDAMPPNVAAELCRILGNAAVDEKAGNGRHTDVRLLAEVRSLGWVILQGGHAELERTLDKIVIRNRERGRICDAAYGSLQYFLALNADPALDSVRDQILAHARSNIALDGKRGRLFGCAVVDGERLSLFQGSKTLAVSAPLLADVLLALNPDFKVSTAGSALLDRRQFLGAKKALQDTMRTSEMKLVLGFNQLMMEAAIKQGLLQCLIEPSQRLFGLVWRRDVTRISNLFKLLPVVAADGLLSPTAIARAGKVGLSEIMVGVVEGCLRPAGRRPDLVGFHGLLFDPAVAVDLWLVLRGQISRRRLMYALGWMPRTITELQRRNLLEVVGLHAVRIDAVKSFRSKYATADEVFSWLENPPSGAQRLHALLRKFCGPPTVAGNGVTAFWPRSLLAAELRPLLRPSANIHAIGFESADYPRNRSS